MSFLKNKWLSYLWLKSESFLILIIFINVVTSAIAGFYTPRFINSFYSSLKSDSDFLLSFQFLLGLFLLEYVNRFCFQLATHKYIQKLLNEVRVNSFTSWMKAPFKRKTSRKHEDYPLGEVLARLMNDTDAVREVVSSGSFGIFIDIIFVGSCLFSFLQLNSFTGLSLFIAEILAAFLLVRGSEVMARVFMDVRKVTGQMARVVTDLTSGLRELFYSPNDSYASKRGDRIFEDFLQKQLRANIWDAGYYSAAESLYPILIALVMLIVPYSKITEVAILAALIDLIQKSITPIKEIASKISVLQRARSGIERLIQFNESFEVEHVEIQDTREYHANKLIFNLNHFKYDEGFELKNIEFTVKQGEVLGILGESGCGKSTILKLLSSQYHTFDGSLHLDTKLINANSEKELRSFSSYVSLISQESHVFSSTLKENITLGDNKNFEFFWNQAKSSIPYLETWQISPEDIIRPKELSMGQKQLISGLRALFLKKPIILLDEISSGLDSELEAALRDMIKFFQKYSMTIVVTHRLETIIKADQLLLLENGKVVIKGKHQDLRLNPKYESFLRHLNS